MAWISPAEDEKPVRWVGSSREDHREFPDEVQNDLGAALSAAQFGGKAERAKPWKGTGSGVFEVVDDYRSILTGLCTRTVSEGRLCPARLSEEIPQRG